MVLGLLRNGCTTYVCTRFPKDAIRFFELEKDYAQFKDRVHLCCVDFKITQSIYEFCEYLNNNKDIPHLDIIINNAAQTVRKPPVAFKQLVKNEIT